MHCIGISNDKRPVNRRSRGSTSCENLVKLELDLFEYQGKTMLGQGSDNNELFISLYNILSHKVSAQIRNYLKAFNYME